MRGLGSEAGRRRPAPLGARGILVRYDSCCLADVWADGLSQCTEAGVSEAARVGRSSADAAANEFRVTASRPNISPPCEGSPTPQPRVAVLHLRLGGSGASANALCP
jgi:hypothetical protein